VLKFKSGKKRKEKDYLFIITLCPICAHFSVHNNANTALFTPPHLIRCLFNLFIVVNIIRIVFCARVYQNKKFQSFWSKNIQQKVHIILNRGNCGFISEIGYQICAMWVSFMAQKRK